MVGDVVVHDYGKLIGKVIRPPPPAMESTKPATNPATKRSGRCHGLNMAAMLRLLDSKVTEDEVRYALAGGV